MQSASYREIPLRRRDGTIAAVALVDEADYADVNRWRWCLGGGGYARRGRTLHVGGEIQRPEIRLHRYLCGLSPGDGLEVDHANRDKLDNRRANLRTVTRAENGQNLPAGRGRSKYRGVVLVDDRWTAQTRLNYRQIYIGRFDTEEEAGAAAAAFRRKHMPMATD